MRLRKHKPPPAEPSITGGEWNERSAHPLPTDTGAALTEIAGYRIIRKLGTDADADLYLGRGVEGGFADDHQQNVSLKLYRLDSGSAQIERELAVRSEVGPGLLGALLDVSTLGDGRVVLVLEHLPGGSLVRYLREHTPLAPGEAVTILAPLMLSVAALHDAGFCLPDLSVASVAFTAAGRPVVDRLGLLTDIPSASTDGALRRDLLRSDYQRLLRVFREVFASLDPVAPAARHAEGIAAWGDEAPDHLPIAQCLEQLERALFEWTPAEPLRMRRTAVEGDQPSRDFPLRRVELRAVAQESDADAPVRARRTGLLDRLSASRKPSRQRGPTAPAPTSPAPTATMALKRGRAKALRRLASRPVLVAAALAIGLSALSLTALSTPGSENSPSVPSTGGPPASAAELVSPVMAADREAIAGDDPVAASIALLALRATCLTQSSVLCLDGVNQTGSAAMAADRYAVRMAQQNATSPPPTDVGTVARLVERNGDSALVEIEGAPAGGEQPGPAALGGTAGYSKPASLLVIRGEAGWRVREIFDY